MKKQLRWRYYCDHCRKAGGQAKAMEKHEAVCTMNPARVCGMCKFADLEQVPLADLQAAWLRLTFAEVSEMASGCPACLLALLRQDKEPPPDFDDQAAYSDYERRHAGEFDFKQASKAWLSEYGRRQREDGY